MVIGSFWDLCNWMEQHLHSHEFSTSRYDMAYALSLRLLHWQCRCWGDDWGEWLESLPWENLIHETEYEINRRNRVYFENQHKYQ